MEDAAAAHSAPETTIPGDEAVETGASAPTGRAWPRLPWESYVRCLMLTAIVFLVGVMTWQPGALRLSLIMSMGTPSRGANLAWKPKPGTEPPTAERKYVQPPKEWRLAPVTGANRGDSRPFAKAVSPTVDKPVAVGSWRRYSANPWNWRDDVGDMARRHLNLSAALPPQKAESPFRAGDIAAWPEQPSASPFQSFPDLAPSTFAPLPDAAQGGDLVLPVLPGLPALPTLPGLPSLPGPTLAATPTTQSPPPIALGAPAASAAPVNAGTVLPPLRPDGGGTAAATPPLPTPTPEPEAVDWRSREITGPIRNAYLTIYPKLKFIGLCVPGQGYIRKYNQVGVPADLNDPKMSARDGRTPYGKYYIADRHRDSDGPRLYLSWPAPDDAKRIGLDAGRQAQVESAWRRKDLPPQDTAAGGGVGLTGLRNWVEVTEGGFTLEAPHMEEIFTALPDGAWVFVQP